MQAILNIIEMQPFLLQVPSEAYDLLVKDNTMVRSQPKFFPLAATHL